MAGNGPDIYTNLDHFQLANGKLTRVGDGGDSVIPPYAISPDGDYYYMPEMIVATGASSGYLTVGLGPYWYGTQINNLNDYSAGFYQVIYAPSAVLSAMTTAVANAQVGADSGTGYGANAYAVIGQCNEDGASASATAKAAGAHTVTVDDTTLAGISGYRIGYSYTTVTTLTSDWGINLPVAYCDIGQLAIQLVQTVASGDYTGSSTYHGYYTDGVSPSSGYNEVATNYPPFSYVFMLDLFTYSYDADFQYQYTEGLYNEGLDSEYGGNITIESMPSNLPYLRLIPWPPATPQGYYYETLDSLGPHTDYNQEQVYTYGGGTVITPSPKPTVSGSTTSTIYTPYGTFTGTTYSIHRDPVTEAETYMFTETFLPWLHVSNKAHYIQGFRINEDPYGDTQRVMYLDGTTEYLQLLATNLGCETDDIRAVYMDIPLSIIQGITNVGSG